MAELAWEKSKVRGDEPKPKRGGERWKFLVGGVLILGAVAYLIFSGTAMGARYFISVNNLTSNPEYVGQTVRIMGAVLGQTIEYDSVNGRLAFTIAHIEEPFDDLAVALRQAVNDPTATRLPVVVEDETKPDLLQHEAQAILTGTLGEDGVFYATELLLKCPSRFEEAAPAGIAGHQQG